MEAIVSIGLNVHDREPVEQLSDTLDRLTALGSVLDLRIIAGEWDGIPERTVQALVDTGGMPLHKSKVAAMARRLSQQCIAITTPGEASWQLIHRDGEVGEGGSVEAFPVVVGVHVDAVRKVA